jgi:hypothetical protein
MTEEEMEMQIDLEVEEGCKQVGLKMNEELEMEIDFEVEKVQGQV